MLRQSVQARKGRTHGALLAFLYAALLTSVGCSPLLAQKGIFGQPPICAVPKLTAGETGGKTPVQAVWDRAASVPRFVNYVMDYLPTQQTEVRLAYDDANLYVAFRCVDEGADKLSMEKAERDKSLGGDLVSVMLDIDGDPKTYFHLSANPAGTQYDEKDRPSQPESWKGEWDVQTARQSGVWTAIFTIPFKSLGVSAPSAGQKWGANFGRRCSSFHERSCWATIRPHLVEPENWGQLVFAPAGAPIVAMDPGDPEARKEQAPVGLRAAGTCSQPRTLIDAPGSFPALFHVSNPGSKAIPLRAVLYVDDKPSGTFRGEAAPGKSEWRFNFRFPLLQGLHQMSFAVHNDATGDLLLRTPQDYVLVPEHRDRLKRYQKMAADMRPRTASAREAVQAVRQKLASIADFAGTADGSSAWADLGRRLDAVAKDLNRVRPMAADSGRRGYVVGTETALTKILRDELFEGNFGGSAKLAMARNERESTQVVVCAYDRGLKGVQAQSTNLRGPGGAVIPAENVRLHLVDFIETRWPRYAAPYAGWWPDPLMDNAAFDVARGALKPVWVTVATPEDIPAGTYRGAVTIQPSDAPATSVPLEVTVWDFTMPTRCHQMTAFALFEYELGLWYNTDVTDEMRREWYAFLLDYRINPTNIYNKSPQPSKEHMEFCVERGLNSFTLACTWHKYEDEQGGKDLAALIKEYEDYLKPRGWWDMTYIYGFDECPRDKFWEMRETYDWIHKRFPDLPRMTTVMPHPELKGYVDIWVPLTSHYLPEQVEEYIKDGDDVWTYVCCHPFSPWANFFVDYSAIDPRIIFWQNWKYEVPGFLYYAMNLWETNRVAEQGPDDPQWRRMVESGKRWPEVPWNPFTCAAFNGDGHLLYPGPGGKPVGSIRLASVRDGIEDYEYFYILKELADRAEGSAKVDRRLLQKAREVLAVRDDTVKSMTEYTQDPRVLLGARSELADLIVRMQKALGVSAQMAQAGG